MAEGRRACRRRRRSADRRRRRTVHGLSGISALGDHNMITGEAVSRTRPSRHELRASSGQIIMDMANELHDGARVSAHRIQPVILSGGYGTRLWPLSRKSLPKQLLPLVSERSLLQETASRTAAATAFSSPLIVCSHEHRDLVAAQMTTIDIEPRLIIAEPVGRNTAPALAVAALVVIATDPDAVLLVEPSDHRIDDAAAFCAAVERGLDAAAAGYLVAFGI
ncbi:MAG TPA: sugar phosphate nucleotidyltransferase, partial [Thermomicrobiales bacterium]|nr:sugar phosphate nucleotidyltransferase [Thermomicrobiales bacterium]